MASTNHSSSSQGPHPLEMQSYLADGGSRLLETEVDLSHKEPDLLGGNGGDFHARVFAAQDAILQSGSSFYGMVVSIMNAVSSFFGIQRSKETSDSHALAKKGMQAAQALSEGVEKSSATLKCALEVLSPKSLNPSFLAGLSVAISAGLSGAAVGLLGITSILLHEKFSFWNQYRLAPQENIHQMLQSELQVTEKEKEKIKKNLSCISKFSFNEGFKLFIYGKKEPTPIECLTNPLYFNQLSAIASKLKYDAELLHDITPPQELDPALHDSYKKVFSYCYHQKLRSLEESKEKKFHRIFGKSISDVNISEVKSDLTKGLFDALFKFTGALAVSTLVTLMQIPIEGTLSTIKIILSTTTASMSVLIQLKNLFGIIQDKSRPVNLKLFNIITSISMILLTIASALIVRFTVTPIASIVISMCWIALAIYSLAFWFLHNKAHH